MIFTVVSYALIALLLMAMLARTRPYRRLEKPGRVLAASGLVLPQKLLLHGRSLAALGTALAFGLAAGWMPASLAALVAAFALAILLMPVRCTLTTEGVAVGEAMFLPWKEFRRATVRDGRLDLRRASFLDRLSLSLTPAESGSVMRQVRRFGVPAGIPIQIKEER